MADLEDRISARYAGLSDRLRDAADYVLANPVEIATRSLRSIAEDSGLAPATFTRLAQALGFPGYEDLRELARRAVGERYAGFSEKAQALTETLGRDPETPFIEAQCRAVAENVAMTARETDAARVESLVAALDRADRVYAAGGLSSHGLMQYAVYLAGFLNDRWRLVGPGGPSAAAALASLGEGDVLLVLTLHPFSTDSIRLVRAARETGAEIAVITDAHACPALPAAQHLFVLPCESPQFFASHGAIVAFLETIVGMLVARAGPDAHRRITSVTNANIDLGWYVAGN